MSSGLLAMVAMGTHTVENVSTLPFAASRLTRPMCSSEATSPLKVRHRTVLKSRLKVKSGQYFSTVSPSLSHYLRTASSTWPPLKHQLWLSGDLWCSCRDYVYHTVYAALYTCCIQFILPLHPTLGCPSRFSEWVWSQQVCVCVCEQEKAAECHHP